jgi:hypothetical protein
MSGQQIGSAVGFVVGAYFGYPQLGMAIGGMIGGWIDPTQINGPHIGDGQQQSSTDGAPIAWVMGTSPMISGTICQVGPRREVKIKDSGKGSGTEVSHYEARQDFAILICESCSLRNSTIKKLLMVEMDGKIVYDVRPGSAMLDDSAKWAANIDFMYGAEDQLPHPTLEAITGIDNTPYYRGSLVMVAKDFNLTQVGDRIPTFRFVVTTGPQTILINAGGDGYGDEHVVSIPQQSGGFTLQYATGGIPDKFQVIDDGEVLVDTGYHGEAAYQASLDTFLDGKGDPRETIHQYPYAAGTSYPPGVQYSTQWASESKRETASFQKTSTATSLTLKHWGLDGTGWTAGIVPTFSSNFTLAQVVSNICARGGLDSSEIDTTALADTFVAGYFIARQSNAADCLRPLLQAYFAYGSEYDGKLNFQFYGQDAVITIDRDDLLEGDDSNNSLIVETKRNLSTEFPRKITGSYYDPEQNYMVVNVPAERLAINVNAIGEQTLEIPVVMNADQAAQAVQKALKIAYATLEGTRVYSVPYARNATYLSLCAGEAVNMDGKRWVLDQVDLSQGALKLSTRYDRQDAYTSNVQAIRGNAPIPPTSRYSGPTTLYAANLPSLRPQDTYGLYLFAASADGRSAWQGCVVQVSYDGQQSWQNALTINTGSTLGTLTEDEDTGSGGDVLTVDVDGSGDLASATEEQLAARANAFALIDGASAEVGQFGTADLVSDGVYALSDLFRELLGTTEVTAVEGTQFTMLDSAYFLPIDLTFKGKTIALRAVGFGEVAEDQPVVTIEYDPDATVIHDGGEITGS